MYEGRAAIAEYRTYYNQYRPHSARHYLCPADYSRGDPPALLAEREAKLHAVADARKAYRQKQGRRQAGCLS